MCIYLSNKTIFVLIFITGLITGVIIHRIMTRPNKPAKPIDYDGTNGKGYQPRPPVPLPEKPHK